MNRYRVATGFVYFVNDLAWIHSRLIGAGYLRNSSTEGELDVENQGRSTKLELVAEEFSFPTSLTFEEAGVVYVSVLGLPFGGATPGGACLAARETWRSFAPGRGTAAAAQRTHVPCRWSVRFRGRPPRRISRFELDRQRTAIVDNLPGPGNYHTNMVIFGPDGKLGSAP
jgi:hypothetical protein